MLDALHTDAVRVSMQLVQYEDDNNSGEGNALLPAKNGKVAALANKFLYLRARVTNMTSTPKFTLTRYVTDTVGSILLGSCSQHRGVAT